MLSESRVSGPVRRRQIKQRNILSGHTSVCMGSPVIFVRGHHLEDQAHMENCNKNRSIKQMAIDDNYLLDSGKGFLCEGETSMLLVEAEVCRLIHNTLSINANRSTENFTSDPGKLI